ncbi:hypothetical protein KFK09_004076 [Dendrobium nobile]|uniref:Uncharacterized protein n=1 Tax=Dendrobium nobile TaxID=94219 RepID=A0A8T3C1X4_DENNO|nr:hypothetical protein KFK09_004076 [Dendrobium nobile]
MSSGPWNSKRTWNSKPTTTDNRLSETMEFEANVNRTAIWVANSECQADHGIRSDNGIRSRR